MDNIKTDGNINLTLNPDEMSKAQFPFGEAPKMETVKMSVSAKSFNAGSIDESMLSVEEKQIVEQFANDINITDSKQVYSYGAAAQRNISDFSVSILNTVKTRDLGDVGESLRELTVALDATTEPEKKGFFGLFQKAQRSIDSIKANYAKAETNVQRIVRDLEQHQVVLMQDISMFEQMYDLNRNYYKELTMYIIAGKKALDREKNETLEMLQAKANATQLQEDVQAYNDYLAICNRFEKKLHDLELTRTITLQSAPQIRMVQNIDEEMLEKIQSSIINTIPLWRNQMVISLGIEHSSRAIAAQNAITQKTNDLLVDNATKLKQATVDSAREAERSIVDIETLKKCNRELISSINEVVKIHEQGSKKRAEAQAELIKIENELKVALLEAGSRR